MGHEIHFRLNSFVNKQNCRIWVTKNPCVSNQHELHAKSFENEDVNVNKDRYRGRIENFLGPAVEDNRERLISRLAVFN